MGLPKFLLLILAIATATAKPFDIKEAIGLNKAINDIKTLYTSQHDIVNIVVPLTRFNESICNVRETPAITIFFVEADINDKGEKVYHGLSVLKNGTATKIVDNGRDATALYDGSKKVYIGASDGLYVYDDTDGTVKKYGNLTDNIIKIEADNDAGILYFVTNDHQVYSVADEGTKKYKVEFLKNVKDLAIDSDGIFFYSDTKNGLYVFNQDGIKKIEGLPGGEVSLVTMFAKKLVVLANFGDAMYVLTSDGGFGKHKQFTAVNNFTAYAPDTGLIQVFAGEKTMFELNGIPPFCAQLNLLMYLSLG